MAKRKSPRLFYMNGELHRALHINRPGNTITAWNYPQSKRVMYLYSDFRKNFKRAYTTGQVSKMINRHVVNIEIYIGRGEIRPPQKTYSLDGERRPGKYYFSDDDIYALHDYLLTVHKGRPRKDGAITPWNLPSRAELRAMLNHEVVTYVKLDDGSFVPTWKEEIW